MPKPRKSRTVRKHMERNWAHQTGRVRAVKPALRKQREQDDARLQIVWLEGA